MSDELPRTVRELRVQVVTGAARAGHVFERTLTTWPAPLPPRVRELNLTACWGYVYGYALAAVLHRVETADPALAGELLHMVNDISMNGDDGRCADVWPDVEAKLAAGGVGTPRWDVEYPPWPAPAVETAAATSSSSNSWPVGAPHPGRPDAGADLDAWLTWYAEAYGGRIEAGEHGEKVLATGWDAELLAARDRIAECVRGQHAGPARSTGMASGG